MYRQRGNALFLILIAVALFAALSYAVTKSGRGSGSISKEQMQLKVAQFMGYLATVQSAVTRLAALGFTADQIKFYSTYNPFAPCTTGDSCVFAPEGGGVTYRNIATDFFPVSWSVHYYEGTGRQGAVTGVGTSAGELMLLIDGVPMDVCNVINQQLKLGSTSIAHSGFNPSDAIDDTYDASPGKLSFCFDDNFPGPSVNNGVYWHVFLAK